MKLSERIRNFFYASTHANQLIKQNTDLLYERDILRSLCSVIDPDSHFSYDRVGRMYFGDVYYARFFIPQELRDEIDKYTYRKILGLAGILPNNNDDSFRELRTKAEKAIGERFLTTPLPADMPVGKIEFIGMRDNRITTRVFFDAGEFVCAIVGTANDCQSASVTVYSDPISGAHLDTSWEKSLGPHRLDVNVKPYNPALYRTVDLLTKDELDEPIPSYEPEI